MGSNGKEDRVTAVSRARAAIAGTQKYLTGAITLLGVSYTPASIVAALESEIAEIRAAQALEAELAQQRRTARAAHARGRQLRDALRKYLLVTHGPSAFQILGDFEMRAPEKPGPKTAGVKADASAKARATRDARRDALAHAPDFDRATKLDSR